MLIFTSGANHGSGTFCGKFCPASMLNCWPKIIEFKVSNLTIFVNVILPDQKVFKTHRYGVDFWDRGFYRCPLSNGTEEGVHLLTHIPTQPPSAQPWSQTPRADSTLGPCYVCLRLLGRCHPEDRLTTGRGVYACRLPPAVRGPQTQMTPVISGCAAPG